MDREVIIAISSAFVGSVAGTVIGWIQSGLFVVTRVNAIEKTLERIELRLDNLTKES